MDDIALSDRQYRENGQKIYTDNFGLTRQDTANSVQRDYVVDYTSAIKNDLMVYEDGGFKTSYTYGANGRISQMTRHLSDEINPVTGKVISTTANEKGQNINSDIAVEKLGKLYYHLDRLGSTAFITDESGMVRSYATYDEWGDVREGGSHDVNIASIDATAAFTTYTYDKILDKYFAQYRMYDAENRRFTAEDPVKDGLNWYNYVGNRPLVMVDPWGLDTLEDFPYNKDIYEENRLDLMLKLSTYGMDIYKEEDLAYDTIDFLRSAMYERGGSIDLDELQGSTSLEDQAIFGAIKKLRNSFAYDMEVAAMDDYIMNSLDALAIQSGSIAEPTVIDSMKLDYMESLVDCKIASGGASNIGNTLSILISGPSEFVLGFSSGFAESLTAGISNYAIEERDGNVYLVGKIAGNFTAGAMGIIETTMAAGGALILTATGQLVVVPAAVAATAQGTVITGAALASAGKNVWKLGDSLKGEGNKTPSNNQAQNKQTAEAARKYKLSKEGQRKLHNAVTKQGYGYDEIMEEAAEIAKLGGKYVE